MSKLSILAGVLAAFLLGSSPVAHAQAPAAPLKKVRIGVGTLVLNSANAYVMMPPVLGYWKDEGYDVEVFAAQSSVAAIQLLVAGKIDFAQVNSGPLLQAVVKNKVPMRTVMVDTVIDWSLVTPESGPVKSIQDFKGKNVGVPALGAGGVPLLEQYFRANGLDPKKDVTLVAVGAGPGALAALDAGRVSGLMFWGSAIAGYEAAGARFKYFFDPAWRTNADYALTTLDSTVKADPKMVEGIARGMAKASEFTLANPDCVRQLHWAAYPDQKPKGTGSEQSLIDGEMLRLNASVLAMKQALYLGKGQWGAITAADFKQLENLFVASGVIDERLPNAADYIVPIPNFFDKVNAFDRNAVDQRARACKPA